MIGPRKVERKIAILGLNCAWLAALILLLCLPAYALDPRQSLAGYKLTRWTAAEGAPPNIWAIEQDSNGYLILGSPLGVYRFDGVTFELIRSEDRELSEGRVLHFLKAKDGTIWAFYDNGRIATYRNGTLRMDRSVKTGPRNPAGVAQTLDGDIWVDGSWTGAPILRHRNGKWTGIFANAGLDESDWYYNFLAARDGSLWVSSGNAIMVKRPGQDRFERVEAPSGKAMLSQDRLGQIWVSDDRGTRRLHPKGGRRESIYPTPPFPDFTIKGLFDRDGNLWMVNAKGIARLRLQGLTEPPVQGRPRPSVESLTDKDGIAATSTVFEDREGNVWVGTTRALLQFRNTSVLTDPMLSTGSASSRMNLLEASDGSVYIALADSLFHVGRETAPTLLSNSIRYSYTTCEASDGAIWSIGEKALARYQRGVVTKSPVPRLLKELKLYDVGGCASDRYGNLWLSRYAIGNRQSGLFSMKNGVWRFHPTPTADWPLAMARGSTGAAVAWLMSGKIVLLGSDGRVARQLADSMPKSAPHMVKQGRNDIFLGGSFGLARVHNSRIEIVESGRFPWIADPTGLAETPEGQTWLLTRAGIAVVATRDLDRAFTDRKASLNVRILDFEDGLPEVRSPNVQNGVARGADGRIWFATLAGIVSVDPARLPHNDILPPVHIRGLKSDTVQLRDPPASLSLAPGTTNVSIRYAGLSLTVPHRVRFRYRLDDVDQNWVEAGDRREAFYTNLGPGTYRFRVLAANNDGVWNHEGATLKFTILPTFFQSIWFKLLCLTAVAMAVLAAFHFRTKTVRANLQRRFDVQIAERERIARALHDTLLQSIQGLVIRFQSIAERLPQGDAARRELEETLDQAEVAIGEGRDQVQALRSEVTPLSLPEALHLSAAKLVGNKAPSVDITVSGAAVALRPPVIGDMLLIAEEAIRNSLRHAEAKKIAISLLYTPSEVVLTISDDGIGMSEDIARDGRREGHYGLVGMRERAEQIGGKVRFSALINGGTEVEMTVPGRRAYQLSDARVSARLRSLWGRLRAGMASSVNG